MDTRRYAPRMLRAATVALIGCAMVCGLLILLGGPPQFAKAAPLAIAVSGNITTNTVWRTSDSPVIVTDTVTVLTGTLTISPGVTVKFDPGKALVIQTGGRLVANGTASQPIIFTSNRTPPTGNCDWETIRLFSNNNIVRYSIIEYARWGIYVEPFSVGHDISHNTFRRNALCQPTPVGAAIAGSPDNTTIANNYFVDNASAIYVTKASGNTVFNNLISGTNLAAVAFVRPISGSTYSSNNHVYSNTIRGAQAMGIVLDLGLANVISTNVVYGNRGEGARLVDQTGSTVVQNQIYNNAFHSSASPSAGVQVSGGSNVTIRDNFVYANGHSSVAGTYRAGLYVAGTQGVRITGNFIHDNVVEDGLEYGPGNSGTPDITSNAVCRNPAFELRSLQALVAEGNWWGTNTPASRISGSVDYTPSIRLLLTPASSQIPANGTSTTVITISLNDGAGHTVPPALRTITLTTSAGTLTPPVVTLNSAGVGTTVLRSAAIPTLATITATERCGFATTTAVTFAAVDLRVVKTASPGPYSPGSLITYTISYTNAGNTIANSVVITETPPVSTTFVRPPGWTAIGGGRYTRSLGSLAPHTGGVVDFVVRIDPALPPAQQRSFVNVVRVGYPGPDFNPADNVYTLTVSGGNLPNLWVVKNDNVGVSELDDELMTTLANTPNGLATMQTMLAAEQIAIQETPVPAGSVISYSIGYGNLGPYTATNVIISETLPANTTFVGPVGPSGWFAGAGGRYTYTIGTLAPGRGGLVHFAVRVNSPLPPGVDEIINRVCIDGSQADLDPSNDCSSEETPVISATLDLGVTKRADVVCAIPGRPINYTIHVTNYGPNNASTVQLREQLPANTVFQGPPSWQSLGSDVYSYTIGSLANGATAAAQFTVLVNPVILPGTTAITNIVSLQGTDQNPANNSYRLVTPLTFGPDLVIAKNDNVTTSVRPGNIISYTIMIVNYGVATATNVVVTETLPNGTSFVGGGPGAWHQVGTSRVYTYAVGSLGPGRAVSPELSFRVRVDNPFQYGDTVVNRVQVGARQPECDMTNNVSTEETPVLGGLGGADLAVSKTDDVPVCTVPGSNIGYTIVFTNHSVFTTSRNVLLTEIIQPAYVTFLGPTGSGGWSGSGSTYTHNAGNVPTTTTRAITFNVRIAPNLPPAVTTITNVVRISATTSDPVPGNNIFTLTTHVPLLPDLAVVKNDNVGAMDQETQARLAQLMGVAGLQDTIGTMLAQSQVGALAESVNPGDVISYTIVYANVGRTTANTVVLTETLPAGTSFVGPLGLWRQVGTSNVYTYAHPGGSLAAGTGSSIQFRVRVNNPFLAGDRVLNTVYIGSRAAECNVTNNVSTDETPVAGAGPGGRVIYLPIVMKNFTNPWATLAWVDQSSDRVRLADDGAGLVADGRVDGRWTLVVNPGTGGAKTITRLVLTSSQGPGVIWDTIPSNPYSVIGVYSGATLLNSGNGSLTRLVSAETSFTLFTSDTDPFTLFPPDRYDYTITVTFSDGTWVEATARIPPALPPTPQVAYVSDLVVDPVSDRVFVASPRHDWVYMLANDALAGNIGVSHGPTGLDVFTRTAGSKVFVAHALDWEHGVRAFDAAGGVSRLIGPQDGFVGSGPYHLAANSKLGRGYVSNYYDKLAVINAGSETRMGWVLQKGWQGAYGIDVSHPTGRVYLATIDTGELVVFDGNGDRLLDSNYIPTHFKPPEGQPCSLYTVAVNERTGHVFIPCPARRLVWVLKESDLTLLEGMAALGEIGILEEHEGGLALVIDAQAVSWTPVSLTSYGATNSVGREGIAVDPLTNRVFIGDPEGDKLIVLQDVLTPTQVSVVSVVPVGDNPQGVDVNPELRKVYVGNAGSNTVTVLHTVTPTLVINTINLTP